MFVSHIGNIYETNDGPCKVLDEDLNTPGANRKVKIQFLNTGNIRELALSNVRSGRVKDVDKPKIDNEVHMSNNYGPFVFVEECGYDNTRHALAKIRFLNTNSECIVTISHAYEGKVKDNFARIIYGVGYLGNVPDNISSTKAYSVWREMLRRCYSSESSKYNFYGGSGVTVDERWHRLEYFLEDLPSLPGYNEWLNGGYELDKDTLQQGVPPHLKVYSKYTCCFIPKRDNAYLAIDTKNANSTCPYRGVYESGYGTYVANANINGVQQKFGSYSDPIAAAHVYNNRCKFYNANFNYPNKNLPEMKAEDIAAARTTRNDMITIIK